MDRRSFLKFMGLGAATAVVGGDAEAMVSYTKPTLGDEVKRQVATPEMVLANPNATAFNLNDDASGLAAYFSAKLIEEYVLNNPPSIKEHKAFLQWSCNQHAMIGLPLTKIIVNSILDRMPDFMRIEMAIQPEFDIMFNKWGELLTRGNSPIDQYWAVSKYHARP